MVVVLSRLSRRISVVESNPSLALLVVDTNDGDALLSCWDLDMNQLSYSDCLGLFPATLSADFDTEQVDLSAVGVRPSLCLGGFTADIGADSWGVGIVAVGDGGTKSEPLALVGKIALWNPCQQ